MNRSELSEVVAIKASLDKSKAKEIVDLMFASMSECLSSGEDVLVTGFGVFKVVKRSARTGRNPRTGDVANIPSSSSVKFTPAKLLKSVVNP